MELCVNEESRVRRNYLEEHVNIVIFKSRANDYLVSQSSKGELCEEMEFRKL